MTSPAVPDSSRRVPGQPADLAATHPDLAEVLTRLTGDQQAGPRRLDPGTRHLVQMASLIASHAVSQYRTALGEALDAGVTPAQAVEVAYQALPYTGTGRTFDALAVLEGVLADRGAALPLPTRATTTGQDRDERGRQVQEQIAGVDAVRRMHAGPQDLRHVQAMLTASCFGDVVARDGLDLPTRELVTLAMLISLGGCDSQVSGHVAANLRVGNDRAVLVDLLTELVPLVGFPRALTALTLLDQGTTVDAG